MAPGRRANRTGVHLRAPERAKLATATSGATPCGAANLARDEDKAVIADHTHEADVQQFALTDRARSGRREIG